MVHVELLNSAASVPEQKAQAAEPATLVFLTKKQVLNKVPVTAPTLWTWVRAGKFPKPRTISPNKTVWIEAEVDAWMKAQPTPRYKP
jgi:predicted DNA-binding transcriptional regulator AlpA